MIKLNNKNITYVALADSNNSIKAPKEIWYADSNNSVKLVYRRKDALIEGEDYEKYHWLKGDGLSFINTLKLIKSDSEVRCTIIPTSDDFTKWQYIYGNNPADNEMTFMCVLLSNDKLHFRHKRGFVSYTTNTEYEFSHSIDSVEVNDEVLPSISESDFQESNRPFYLFNASSYQSTSGLLFDGYIRYLILSEELNLIPCKLLKPVPKWLDANGIRRQAGECGMIDLVSGKFYGNVNSVGTFTVENYYERKEWLVGDGSAYIQISQTSKTDFNINLTYKLSNVYKQMLYGSFYSTSGGWKGNMLTWGETNGIADKILLRINTNNGNNYINLGAQNIDVVHTIKVIDGHCYFDDADRGVCPGYSIYSYDKPFLLFNGYNVNTITESNASNASISKFSIEGYCNLIPCTLTMDLPASMDANNIARTKGTSGMWDLVSDRFYGNVANSGTFKAVNLAEGVDYEVHDWLVGDGSAYIDTNKSLVETDVITTKFILTNVPSVQQDYYLIYGNSAGKFTTTACIQFHNDMQISPIATNRRHVMGYQLDSEYTISHSVTEILVNGTSAWQGTSVFETISIKCYLFATGTNVKHCFNGKVGYFNISDSLNLTPCRLLRSIPAELDANGIARSAGECGMYDTVNDKFYGNVASSGSFSVSDDS